jgi:magnesium-transporting ATPase (P-type)
LTVADRRHQDDRIARPEASVAWHAVSVGDVEQILRTNSRGLSAEEARHRLSKFGPNQIEDESPTSALRILANQFRSPLIYILVVAAVVTFVLEEFVDTGVITAVLLLNAVIGFTQERRAERSVHALMQLVAPHARVIRDGREVEIDSRDVVPGDLILLESGVRVAADIRLARATSLHVDESLLTGESDAVVKHIRELPEERVLADRVNLVYGGTIVTSGRGAGYAVATAADTVIGSIAERVREDARPETPLQHRMARFSKIIGIVILLAAMAVFAIGMIRGEDLSDLFVVVVAMAVAAIPEGLPVAFTITLAVGVRRMANRNAIVRRLPAVETLGSTTTIGSDKTGTLTENIMTVRRVWTSDGYVDIGSDIERMPEADDEDAMFSQPVLATLIAGSLTNEGTIEATAHGFERHGDPTETAILVAAAMRGIDVSAATARWPQHVEAPFESERQYSASVRQVGEKQVMFVKGAPERVLEMSASLMTSESVVPIDREAVLTAAHELASEGLRVIAMARRTLDDPLEEHHMAPEPEMLTFLGMVGMMDPPRPEAQEAVAACQSAGIRVIMITGDHAVTAGVIARQLGISDHPRAAVTGQELSRMSDDELQSVIADVPVYARVSPDQKLRIVKALQHHGEVVAITGDGVNDAPALKSANIGIAMGRSGTDVAREASDMVLTDDNFASIYAAVEQGRVTFDNVRKVTFFLISTGAAAILAILVSVMMGWPIPFVAAQLLWLNLVTNGLQDVALAFEPGEPDVTKRKPRPVREGVISGLLWERTALVGIVIAAGTLVMFHWALDRGGSTQQAQTVALTTMVIFQMLHVGNARSDHRSVFTISPFSNRFLFIATGAALLIHIAALHWSATQYVLRVEPIGLGSWARIVAVALSIIVVVELHKRVRRTSGSR